MFTPGRSESLFQVKSIPNYPLFYPGRFVLSRFIHIMRHFNKTAGEKCRKKNVVLHLTGLSFYVSFQFMACRFTYFLRKESHATHKRRIYSPELGQKGDQNMNLEQYVSAVHKVIQKRKAPTVKRFHICIWEKELCCLPANHTKQPHRIFKTFYESAYLQGWTFGHWRKVAANVKYYMENQS